MSPLSNAKETFLQFQAQTTNSPLGLEIERAEGNYLYTTDGKRYLDFIAGVSANPLGHRHPKVLHAMQEQMDRYLHVMVYGEFIQKSSIKLCSLLADLLPNPLETTYLTNSGTEAIEGAIKLAKRYTGRSEIVACKNAYHGNTMGSMSVSGNEESKQAYRPLIPNTRFIEFNQKKDIQLITEKSSAFIVETIQGAAGFLIPDDDYFLQVKRRCEETGALLILDEIQSGFGRTGRMFAFEHYGIVPDILVVGKAFGGGMPIGAFISSHKVMSVLKENPPLGHITTFGGHPVISAAALATLEELMNSPYISQVQTKENQFRSQLVHPLIEEIRGKGLMLAIMLKKEIDAQRFIKSCLEKGALLFGLLYEKQGVRITPPLTVREEEIQRGCSLILEALDGVYTPSSMKPEF